MHSPRSRGKWWGLAMCFLMAGVAGLAAGATGTAVEDLLFDLYIVPLDSEGATDFTLESLAGEKVSLRDFRGRAVLLYFWATS